MTLPDGWNLVLNTSEKKIGSYWEKLKDFSPLFTDSTRNDEENWFRKLYGEVIILENEGGIVVFNNFSSECSAEVHISFWDKKVPPQRVNELKEILLWFFVTFDFHRVEAFVPEYARGVQRFIEQKLGFTHEGRMRNRIIYQGQLTDVKIYSILKEEVL
jgi:RimJ/RimL family protein N-acetyltransferase